MKQITPYKSHVKIHIHMQTSTTKNMYMRFIGADKGVGVLAPAWLGHIVPGHYNI